MRVFLRALERRREAASEPSIAAQPLVVKAAHHIGDMGMGSGDRVKSRAVDLQQLASRCGGDRRSPLPAAEDRDLAEEVAIAKRADLAIAAIAIAHVSL